MISGKEFVSLAPALALALAALAESAMAPESNDDGADDRPVVDAEGTEPDSHLPIEPPDA